MYMQQLFIIMTSIHLSYLNNSYNYTGVFIDDTLCTAVFNYIQLWLP